MNAIEVTGVTKTYPEYTLDRVSLTLPSGMILGLIGENGAGKTTLIKSILGMIPIDGGTVSVLGCTSPHQNKQIMEDIGVVMDESGMPPFLNIVQIGTMMKDIFQNWDSETFNGLVKQLKIPENTKFADLSKGNQMKTGIVCALSHHPKLLILDEATSGLDPVIRDEVLDLLLDFTREEDHSILVSSHIVSDLEKICDYIVFLHEGKVLLSEEKDLLKEAYGIMHCTREQLEQLDSSAVIGKRINAYGAEVVVRKDAVPAGTELSPVDLEELFVRMVKEG